MPGDHESSRHRAELAHQRLEILDALVGAIERRTEVLNTIAASRSADVACDELAELLGISAIAAAAVLDLQVRRFAGLERARITGERDQIVRDIGR